MFTNRSLYLLLFLANILQTSSANGTVFRLYSAHQVLPERDYLTFEYMLSQIRLSSVTFVHPTQGVEAFGNISSLLCTLATL